MGTKRKRNYQAIKHVVVLRLLVSLNQSERQRICKSAWCISFVSTPSLLRALSCLARSNILKLIHGLKKEPPGLHRIVNKKQKKQNGGKMDRETQI